jgi:hypothetical protein
VEPSLCAGTKVYWQQKLADHGVYLDEADSPSPHCVAKVKWLAEVARAGGTMGTVPLYWDKAILTAKLADHGVCLDEADSPSPHCVAKVKWLAEVARAGGTMGTVPLYWDKAILTAKLADHGVYLDEADSWRQSANVTCQ